MANHKAPKKRGKLGVEVVAGLAGLGTMVAMAPASFADTVKAQQGLQSGGYTSEKSLTPQELTALQQQLKTVETVISTDGLSHDLEGTLNQTKLENVTTVLQGISSYLQKALGESTYVSQLSQISSQLSSIAGEQRTSLSQDQQESMRTSLQKITSQLEQIVSEELASQESNLKSLQNQLSDAQKTAATDESNLKADDAAYASAIAALKKAASSALANAQSANTTAQSNAASAQAKLDAAKSAYTDSITALKGAASSALANAQSANTTAGDNVTSAQNKLTSAQAVENYTSQILTDANGANTDLQNAEKAATPSDAVSSLQAAQSKLTSAIGTSNSAIAEMPSAGFSQSSISSAKSDLNSATAAQSAIAKAINDANAWQTANAESAAAQAVAGYTSQILSDANGANGELKGAEAALDPQAAAPYLQNALKEVEKAIGTSTSAINQMANAGFSTTSQADARIDLDSAQIVKMDIENALDQIESWQAENEATTKAQLLVSELTSDIASTKDALGAYGQMGSDLQLVSKVLAEPFAEAAGAKAAAYTVEKAAPTSKKPLASTGSSAQDVEIASAILLAGGIAAEAVKKMRERRERR